MSFRSFLAGFWVCLAPFLMIGLCAPDTDALIYLDGVTGAPPPPSIMEGEDWTAVAGNGATVNNITVTVKSGVDPVFFALWGCESNNPPDDCTPDVAPELGGVAASGECNPIAGEQVGTGPYQASFAYCWKESEIPAACFTSCTLDMNADIPTDQGQVFWGTWLGVNQADSIGATCSASNTTGSGPISCALTGSDVGNWNITTCGHGNTGGFTWTFPHLEATEIDGGNSSAGVGEHAGGDAGTIECDPDGASSRTSIAAFEVNRATGATKNYLTDLACMFAYTYDDTTWLNDLCARDAVADNLTVNGNVTRVSTNCDPDGPGECADFDGVASDLNAADSADLDAANSTTGTGAISYGCSYDLDDFTASFAWLIDHRHFNSTGYAIQLESCNSGAGCSVGAGADEERTRMAINAPTENSTRRAVDGWRIAMGTWSTVDNQLRTYQDGTANCDGSCNTSTAMGDQTDTLSIGAQSNEFSRIDGRLGFCGGFRRQFAASEVCEWSRRGHAGVDTDRGHACTLPF